MRGTGPIGWGGESAYGYFTVGGGVTRVRVSVDEADRLGVVEGQRVNVALPGKAPAEGPGGVAAFRGERPELVRLPGRSLGVTHDHKPHGPEHSLPSCAPFGTS